MDISEMRREYAPERLRRANLNPDPHEQFNTWFQQAQSSGVLDVNAMSLATVAANGRPSLRTVLLKYVDKDGFVFFTNYESTKATDIAANSTVALLFFWPLQCRQIIIRGTAAKINKRDSVRYFLSRPEGSQLGAWVSNQSRVISSRSLLEKGFAEMREKFSSGRIPMPPHWGGYRVTAAAVEFWQGAPDRLHDRFLYRQSADARWLIERLAP